MNFSGPIDDYAPQFESKAWLETEEIEACALKSPLWSRMSDLHRDMPERDPQLKREIDMTRCSASVRGKEVELSFAQIASDTWKVYQSSLREDKVEHIDFYLQRGSLQIPLDVKALRSISRKRGIQNKYVWVELHPYGFLFSGKSTCIALQYSNDKFLLLNKAALANLVKRKFDPSTRPVRWSNQAFERAYQREDSSTEWIGFLELTEVAQECAVDLIKSA